MPLAPVLVSLSKPARPDGLYHYLHLTFIELHIITPSYTAGFLAINLIPL